MRLIHTIPHITTRQALSDLRSVQRLSANIPVVYIYYLTNTRIPYPIEASNILYVGEALRTKMSTGVRFTQHITPTSTTGSDTGSNLTLSQYFHQGISIGLRIYRSEDRKRDERELIYSHINLFGAPPICQNNIPLFNGRNRTSDIFNYLSNPSNSNRLRVCNRILNQINR